MSTAFNDIIKQGYVRFKRKKLGNWQRKWLVLRKASSKGPHRLERYIDDKAVVSGKCEKVIDLSDAVEVQKLPPDIRKNALAVLFRDRSSKTFSCEADQDVDSWLYAFKIDILGRSQNFRTIDLLQAGPTEKEVSERFNVYLLPSPNLAVMGECLMQITQENIYLLDVHDQMTRIVEWPLNALRRYGRDDSKFTFESGRYCDTGEGVFIFNTTEGEAIYQKVHSATIAIAEAHRLIHRQQLNRVGSLPIPVSPTKPPFHTSLSTPSTSANAPEPPPRPSGSTGGPLSYKTSLQMPLPPIPTADKIHDEPPIEQAPRPPEALLGQQVYYQQNNGRGPDGYVPPAAEESGSYILLRETSTSKDRYLSLRDSSDVSEYQVTSETRPETKAKDEDYMYEEKGLTPAFRGYLKERKDKVA